MTFQAFSGVIVERDVGTFSSIPSEEKTDEPKRVSKFKQLRNKSMYNNKWFEIMPFFFFRDLWYITFKSLPKTDFSSFFYRFKLQILALLLITLYSSYNIIYSLSFVKPEGIWFDTYCLLWCQIFSRVAFSHFLPFYCCVIAVLSEWAFRKKGVVEA